MATNTSASAWITEAELRNRLPREGDGVTSGEIEEAISASIEYVRGIGGDQAIQSSALRSAAAKLAHADALDVIFPRDGRGADPLAVTLRENAEALVSRYRNSVTDSDNDGVPDVPAGYTGVISWP